MSLIDVLYAKAGILHSFVQEHKSMVASASQTGTSRNTRRQSMRTVKLTIDGETKSHMSMSMVQTPVLSRLKRYSNRNVQQQQ